jgi:outer membrane beta-barrel protein
MKNYWLVLTLVFTAGSAFAQAPAPSGRALKRGNETQELEKVKKRYWAAGEEAEIGVVQNRTYAKSEKFELGVFGGLTINDPFLNTKTAGIDIGYNVTEYFGLHAVGWKSFVSPSSALVTFEREKAATANTNLPKSYLGLEALGSVFYGKLSVLGAKIIYYDLHLAGGAGVTETENGNYLTPGIGIGQRFYANKWFSVRIDYRLQFYKEDVKQKTIVTQIGQTIGQRNVFSNTITVGLQFLLGGF